MPKNKDKKKKRSSIKEEPLTREEFFKALTKASAPICEPSEKEKKQTSE